jgi:hypothetical protein
MPAPFIAGYHLKLLSGIWGPLYIVAKIDEEQQLVNSNKELIRIFEQKIVTTINRLWNIEQ